MKRNFDEWLKTFKNTVADWTYYTDFPKVYRNVDEIKIELNLLNSLINSKNIHYDFINLAQKYPNVLKAIPILIAKRQSEIMINSAGSVINFDFNKENPNVFLYSLFMEKSGLYDLLENHIISDLVDYVMGVEVGLDSNARKNRTGKAMQNIVERFLIDMGFIQNQTYFTEMTTLEIESKFQLDLSSLTTDENTAIKRFDFVVAHNNFIYAIEVNFYSSGGSKLNETARSYKLISQEMKGLENIKFVWITDGKGWLSAKNNLRETYYTMEYLFNLQDLEDGKLRELLK